MLLVPALRAGQTGRVHDVVRHLDYTLTGQDWPAADLANGVFGTQHILPMRCAYSVMRPAPPLKIDQRPEIEGGRCCTSSRVLGRAITAPRR